MSDPKIQECEFCGDKNPMFSRDGDFRLRCHKGTEWDPETGKIFRHGDCSPCDVEVMGEKGRK